MRAPGKTADLESKLQAALLMRGFGEVSIAPIASRPPSSISALCAALQDAGYATGHQPRMLGIQVTHVSASEYAMEVTGIPS